MNAEIIKQAAEKEIACHPDQKNIRFKIDDTIFWIKRKYSNKRNRLIKQPPETEFLFEVARIAIAAKACPELVPQIEVLTSEYMVTRDGGPTIEDWMEDPDLPFEEKKKPTDKAASGNGISFRSCPDCHRREGMPRARSANRSTHIRIHGHP